jgi:hypothetical protein
MDGRLEAGAAHALRNPFGRPRGIVVMLGPRAYAGYAEEVEELLVDSLVMLGEVLIEIGRDDGFGGSSRHERW